MTPTKPTLSELAVKHGGKPCVKLDGEPLPDCWRFLFNRDCRAWASEARQLGYNVFDSLDIGGAIPDDGV